MERRLIAILGVCLISLGACNKRAQQADEGQSQHAASSGDRGTGSSAGYLGGGDEGYLAGNKSLDEPAAPEQGEELAHSGDEESSPPPGDGCRDGVDCCEVDEECVATQFAGCCATDDTPAECEWSVMNRDALARERELCTRVRCAPPALPECAADNDGKEAQCVLGRCRLVPFR